MSNMISEVISVRTLLEKDKALLRYDECGESLKWPLYEDRVYIIPGYQREIQWGKNNAQVFLRDLSAEKKYLGNILISTSDKKEYQVIDGQQRLTMLIMILKKIKSIEDVNLCSFQNDTFPMFFEAIKNSFIFKDSQKEEEYIKSDYLNQRSAMKELWDTISDYVNTLSEEEQHKLVQHVLDSEICVLIAKVDKGISESRRVCVDYFIDINNKSKELEHIDILKAYAFRESFDKAAEKWIHILKNTNMLQMNKGAICYPTEDLFYHFFICQVNKKFDYKRIRISDKYKLNKDFDYQDRVFSKGTDIEILIEKPSFYKDMLERILSFQEFMKIIQNDKTSPGRAFCDLIKCDEKIDYDLQFNIFIIINSILKNTDMVPKLLVMKYYLDVLEAEKPTKKMFESIYWININASFFSAAKTKRKSIDALAGLVMRKDWIEALEEKAKEKLNIFPNKIGFDKVIYQGGKATTTSGQFLSRRLHGIFYSVYRKNDCWKVNQKKYKSFMESSAGINDEHFLVNRNGKVTFKYNNGDNQIIYQIPSKTHKTLSYISNYLMMNSDINIEIGNSPVSEKIRIIEEYRKSGEKVFCDCFSEQIYLLSKEVFEDNDKDIVKKMQAIKNEDEAKKLLNEYYTNDYLENFRVYVEKIYDLPVEKFID